MDLRERIVGAVQAGRSRHDVARIFGVSASCVIKPMQQFSALGHCRPKKFGGYKRPILAEHEDAVRALLRARPDLTISELLQELSGAGIKVGRSSVGRFVGRLDLTYKKTLRAAEQQRPDGAAARRAWGAAQKSLDPSRLVFIDETWASTNMAPRYGRCEKRERLVAHVPFGHWKTTTLIAALRHDGLTAPSVFEGPINGAKFRAYVEQILVPTLKPGDLVLMDNLASHEVAGVRQAIEAAGAERRFMPPTAPIWTPSNRCSPRSKIRCAKWPAEPSTPSRTPSASQSTTSPPPHHRRSCPSWWCSSDGASRSRGALSMAL